MGDDTTAKSKVKDHFPERKKKEEEEAPDDTITKSKVKDHFPERRKKEKEEEKILIKPADVTLRPKEEVPEPVVHEEEEETPDDTIAKSKVKDHFPERKRK